MNIPQPIIDFFDAKYGNGQEAPKAIYRIKWRGRFIAAPSGKTVWKTIGAAKNAFNRWSKNYLFKPEWKRAFPESVSKKNYYHGGDFEYVDTSRFKEVVHFLQEQKLLEFVKIEE